MKIAAILLLMFGFYSLVKGQGATFNLLIGTYTQPGKSDGIYVYSFNSETGEFSYKAEAPGIKNPSFLAITKDKKFLYTVSEAREGMVSAYSFDPASGKLVLINSVSSGGNGPCYVATDSKNKFLYVGNYGGGSLSAIPLKADGSLSQEMQTITYEGKSVKSNQDKSHVHAAVLSHDDQYLFVPDLGTDKVYVYHINATKVQPLTPANPAFVSVDAGNGPRHFTFHPNGKFAYLIQEMTGVVTAYDYSNGKLTPKQSVAGPASGASGKIDAADIHVSPDGKFLYSSLRGDINEIVIYSIDTKGALTFVGRQSTLGKTPRNFAIDPTGNFLLVGNQNSDEIIIFKRDHKTGLLKDSGKKIAIGAPVCLKFVEGK
ncbi:MAG: 3-carboxymuconate cyclase [Marivirga sp.]|nr:3-carboxymuconate cyclase [Marivirga sp.]